MPKKIRKKRQVNVSNKVKKIIESIGKLKGKFVILDKPSETDYYKLCLEIIQGNKTKYKVLFSNKDLELIKTILEEVNKELNFEFDSEPKSKIKQSKKSKDSVDYSIFREHNGNLFILLTFGSIWLVHDNKFHIKRNYEKIDGIKIYELKSNIAYLKCQKLLLTYNELTKNKILKEVIRLGDMDSKNTVRNIMGLDSLDVICTNEGKILQLTEKQKKELNLSEEDSEIVANAKDVVSISNAKDVAPKSITNEIKLKPIVPEIKPKPIVPEVKPRLNPNFMKKDAFDDFTDIEVK
jgi:hypothetical protein